MNKRDLALNDLQWLICHKTKPNLIYLIYKKHTISFQTFFIWALLLIVHT